jgi:site-specific recombinase XerC
MIDVRKAVDRTVDGAVDSLEAQIDARDGELRGVLLDLLSGSVRDRRIGAGVPLRTLQEWLGHRDLATTQIYADYAPSSREAEMVALAFSRAASGAEGPWHFGGHAK